MQATWRDTNYEDSNFTTFEDARYNSNDFLALITSVKFVHDSDSDNEFNDDQKAKFQNNLVVKHEKLIKNYLRDRDILEVHKTKNDV